MARCSGVSSVRMRWGTFIRRGFSFSSSGSWASISSVGLPFLVSDLIFWCSPERLSSQISISIFRAFTCGSRALRCSSSYSRMPSVKYLSTVLFRSPLSAMVSVDRLVGPVRVPARLTSASPCTHKDSAPNADVAIIGKGAWTKD